MNDVKKNFVYNVIYQILILIIPLITTPYVSKTIGATGIGTYSYTYSIVYYFMIFSMLGLNNYGNRTIAKNRENKIELSKRFKEIHLFQIITSTTMITLYFLYILIFDNKYFNIALIQSLYVISCMFDINWFFFGIEKFKLTITRNTIIKILSLIFIFIFVKNKNDIWIYTLILSSSTLLSQLLLWPFVNQYITKVKINLNDIKKHIKPCIKLFLPVIAVSIYKIMDKTMIGMLSNVDEVGYYDNAEKIINVPIAIITAAGTVMLPRMSNMHSKGESSKTKPIILKTMKFMGFLSFAMMFGIMAIAKKFSIVFFGTQFIKTGDIIMLLTITIIFLSWGNVIRTQYLIPKEMDKEYIISAFLGAIVNFILNIIFIKEFKSIGACIGTIAAEFVVALYQTIVVRKNLEIKKYITDILPFFIKSIIMFIIIYPLNFINLSPLITIIIQITLGIITYSLLNIKYILSVANFRHKNV